MKTLNKELSGWILARVWLSALEETARDFHGTYPKPFCSRAYEHATSAWLRILQNEYGFEIKKSHGLQEAIENYIDIGVRGGLFNDPSNFKIKEINPNKVEISILVCPYGWSCKDAIDHGFSHRDLTCARLGCFAAAVKILTEIPCTYEVVSVDSEVGCHGFIERA